MHAKPYAIFFIGAAHLLSFVSACSDHPGDSAELAESAASAKADSGTSICGSQAVMNAVSVELKKWLDQHLIDDKSIDTQLHANDNFGIGVQNGVTVAHLQAGVTVGGLLGTEQCRADVSVSFGDASRINASARFSVEFVLNADGPNGPQVTLDETSLLRYDGAFSTTGSLLAEEAQRERDGMTPTYYAVLLCFSNPGCQPPPASDAATYRSAQGCMSAMMSESPGGHLINNRLYLDNINSQWLECYEKSAASQWEPLPRNTWLQCYNAESSKEAPTAAALKCYSSSPVPKP